MNVHEHEFLRYCSTKRLEHTNMLPRTCEHMFLEHAIHEHSELMNFLAKIMPKMRLPERNFTCAESRRNIFPHDFLELCGTALTHLR